MTILVAGASGATGREVVAQLINLGQKVKVIVRSPQLLPESWADNEQVSIIHASILDISDMEMSEHVKDCQAVVSCLGHNINWKGIYGQPRKLVTDAVKKLSKAISVHQPEIPVKFVLMNTTGNSNRDLNEAVPLTQKLVVGLIRLLLPPQVDNEKAADYLRTKIGQTDNYLEWVAVRPDGLIDQEKVTAYEIFASPVRNPIFNPGKTSRINVGHFMAALITDKEIWNKWKGQMPVIYNKEF
jgi:hypothetical protein